MGGQRMDMRRTFENCRMLDKDLNLNSNLNLNLTIETFYRFLIFCVHVTWKRLQRLYEMYLQNTYYWQGFEVIAYCFYR